MTDYKLIAISKLLNCGYNIFMPFSNRKLDYDYIVEYANVLQTLKILPVHYNMGSPTVRLVYGNPPRLRSIYVTQLLCAVETSTKRIWLIPFEDVCDNTLISLKQRYDSYIITDSVINEEGFSSKNSKTKSVFTEAAKDLANKIKDTKK